MFALVVVPVLVAIASCVLARRAAARLRPPVAVILLTSLGLTISLGVGLVLSLVAYIGIGDFVPVLRPVDWSPADVRRFIPVPPVVGAMAALLVATLLARSGAYVVRVLRSMRAASAATGGARVHAGMVILAEESLVAYAQPRRGGRGVVVVSRGMLRALTGAERRALLAHERAHLDHHHHLYVWAARLAAAANPLVTPLARAVDVAVEKWADSEAVRDVGDPRIVARAIGAAAGNGSGQPRSALGAGGGAVVERVRFLLDPPPKWSRAGAAWLIVGMAFSWISVVAVLVLVYDLIQAIEAAQL